MPQPATSQVRTLHEAPERVEPPQPDPARSRDTTAPTPAIPPGSLLDPDQAATTRLRFSPRERPVFES